MEELTENQKKEIKKIMDKVVENDMFGKVMNLLPDEIFESDLHAVFQIELEDSLEKSLKNLFKEKGMFNE